MIAEQHALRRVVHVSEQQQTACACSEWQDVYPRTEGLPGSKEKPAWLKRRYETSLRALERAKREWYQMLASVQDSLCVIFDPSASQGTYKQAAKVRATTPRTPGGDKTQA